MVKEGMSEESIESSDYLMKVLNALGWNRDSAVEVFVVLDYASCLIQVVDHVIYCRTVLGHSVRGT